MLCFLESFFLLLVDNIVEVVLHQDRDHGVGGHPEIESRQSHPQIQKSFVFDTLEETIHEILVGKHTLSVYITNYLLGFIFRILVLMLSKGSEPTEAEIPAVADPNSLMKVVSLVSLRYFCRSSLTSL